MISTRNKSMLCDVYKNHIFFLILFLITSLLSGCISHKEDDIEIKLNKELLEHKSDNTRSLDLTKTLGTDWKKVCIRGPYHTQKGFEESTGEKIEYFSELPEGIAMLIFYKDGSSGYIQIDESIMALDLNYSICTSIKNPYIFFAVDPYGKKNFSLNDKG